MHQLYDNKICSYIVIITYNDTKVSIYIYSYIMQYKKYCDANFIAKSKTLI